jgi:hypothetical protein
MAVTPRVLQVVELGGEAGEIAHAVVAAVGEGADMHFIDDGVLVPEGIGAMATERSRRALRLNGPITSLPSRPEISTATASRI